VPPRLNRTGFADDDLAFVESYALPSDNAPAVDTIYLKSFAFFGQNGDDDLSSKGVR
jgi:hypothetical protein